MVGSSRAEKVVAFQKVRKFATSRLITPVIAAGSRRRMRVLSRRLTPPPPR